MKALTRLALAGFFVVFFPHFASAQEQCGPRAVVIAHLAENFGESRQSIGLGQEGRVVEVFASIETGSWTITVTLPNGLTCLVAAGTSFEVLSEEASPTGEAL